MNIYENSKPSSSSAKKYENPIKSTSRNNVPPQQVVPKKILNDQDLTSLVKKIKNGPSSAKEILYDSEKKIIGVLQRNDTPFFFSPQQIEELRKLREN